VADLQAERDTHFDAFGLQRVVPAVAGRQVPQPRHHPQRTKAKIADGAPQFPHRVHWAGEIYCRDTCEPARVAADHRSDGVVSDQRPPRHSPPHTIPVRTPAASIAATVASTGTSFAASCP
jgi:hypothetical protein